VSATICGPPVTLSVTVTDAERAPAAVGANVTLIVQAPEAKTVNPQVFVSAKSPGFVPVIVMLEIDRTPIPGFVKVIVFAALVSPVTTPPKARVAVLSVMPGVTPMPASETI
jgi:hypothetical protein